MSSRRPFLHLHPKPPWDCIFCGRPVVRSRDLEVHHLNGDQDDESEENLQPGHCLCHDNYHTVIRNWAAMLGIPASNPLVVEAAWARFQALKKSQS